jgi:hypothetical protein
MRHPDQRQLFRHLPRQQRLQDDIGIGQRQEVQGVAEIQVALDDPEPNHGPTRNSSRMPIWLLRRRISHLCAASQPLAAMASAPGRRG